MCVNVRIIRTMNISAGSTSYIPSAIHFQRLNGIVFMPGASTSMCILVHLHITFTTKVQVQISDIVLYEKKLLKFILVL